MGRLVHTETIRFFWDFRVLSGTTRGSYPTIKLSDRPWCGQSIRLAPDFPTARRQLAACYAAAGEVAKAQQALADYLALEPTHTAASIRERFPVRDPEGVERYIEALRRAGLPE